MNPNRSQSDEQDFDQANRLINDRQFFPRRPKKAAELIAQLMARKGWGQSTAIDELDVAWKSVATTVWSQQTQLGNVRKGVLEVIVANSALLQQLEFKKQSLVASLQQRLPQNKIKDIRFRIGNVTKNYG
jgi:hypothetical protein